MFTGIIEALGKVELFDGKRLRVLFDEPLKLAPGDSVAVDGVCLTAERVGEGWFEAYLSQETLSRTKFGRVLRPGYLANLETPLTPEKFLSGHLVQGHVDAVGRVARLLRKGEEAVLEVEIPAGWERYLVEKGSVAVDGVSLTVARLRGRRFSVAVIPETLKRTNLGLRRAGEPVNLEFDVVAKYVERFLKWSR